MPNTSGKDYDRRYGPTSSSTSSRRKSSDEEYYFKNQFLHYQDYNQNLNNQKQMYRNSSREKKTSSSQSNSDIKEPIRTLGEWSEFLSSSGKIYYFNNKTEKAQWDKPEEWDWMMMREEKASKNYYQPSGKDYRNMNHRYRNKYDDLYDSPSNIKPRYNNYENSKPYQRDYSNDYMNPNSFRQNSYGHPINDRSYTSNSGQSMQFHPQQSMQDYYDSNPNYSGSFSNSTNDYYNQSSSNSSNQNTNGPPYRGGYTSQSLNKEWINDHQQNSRFQSSGQMYPINNNQKGISARDDDYKSPRYQMMNNYDDQNINKSYMYQQKHHLSRYDSYNENQYNNRNNYQSNFHNSTTSHAQSNANESDYNQNEKPFNKQLSQQSKDSYIGQSHSDYYEQPNRNYSRSRSSSENNLSPRNSIKKFKKSEDSSTNLQTKTRDNESWDDSPVKTTANESNKQLDDKQSVNENSNMSVDLNQSRNLSNQNEQSTCKLSENLKHEEINSNNDSKKLTKDQNETGDLTKNNTKVVDESKENQKFTNLNNERPIMNGPVLSSTVEDISKYYRPELASRLTSCLGVVENLSWINQPFLKHCSYSKLSVEIKNFRSIVRIKEIKKTLQEQRLLFLQTQMKEIEELLS